MRRRPFEAILIECSHAIRLIEFDAVVSAEKRP
jgi:hypothetical protein